MSCVCVLTPILRFFALSEKFVFFADHLFFKNSELVQIWLRENTKEKRLQLVLNFLLERRTDQSNSDKFLYSLKEKVRLFCKNLASMWEKSHRRLDDFQAKHAVWLTSESVFEKHHRDYIAENITEATSSGAGRPRLSYAKKSDRSKRREAAELSSAKNNETDLLVRAASVSARKQGRTDLAVVLKESMGSPTRPTKMRKLCLEETKTPTLLSNEEALAFLLENNFSKQQYCSIREKCKQRNANIFPSYMKIIETKQSCRPNGIDISEKMAKVPLQMLISHTGERIVELQKEVIVAVMNSNKNNLISAELILSCGFDSSSGQALYKQGYQYPSTSHVSESSLLATTVIPLRLLDTSGTILWNNRTPQSTRFCRPLKLEFIKETKEVILKEESDLKEQINKLEKLRIQIDTNKNIEITFRLYVTVIDGKVLNVLTGTKSTQACPICGATPKDFINIKNYSSEKFRPIEGNLKYGISPLHCWIRFFEFVLHIAYKSDIKKWQIREYDDKEAVKKKKADVQNSFWTELGLRVDLPKIGGCGTTNDGNTSRRAFAEHEKFAKITGVDQELIFRLKIILICLSCQFPLNLEKFEKHCFQTAECIQTKYPWLPMTPTVHKVLIHSKEIMKNTPLPVGCFAEDAAESRNKIYKADRLYHARKTGRIDNLTDVFCRALDTSDPLISSLCVNTRVHQRKRLSLPAEVIELLTCEGLSESSLLDPHGDLDESSDEEVEYDEVDEEDDENLILEAEFSLNGNYLQSTL